MKTIDQFLLHDILKSFKKQEVAFYIDDICTYNKAMASIRMRCYDILLYLEKQGVAVELYKPWKKYKIVLFIKTQSDKAVRTAKKLNAMGTKVMFDAYCEYITDESKSQDKERCNILKIASYSNQLNVCSIEQQKDFMRYHSNVVLIPESVNDKFFTVKKEHKNTGNITLVYCGYAKKAKDTLCIENELKWAQQEFGCKLLYLCEQDPQLEQLSYDYIKYEQSEIQNQLLLGDIMIAPRPMEGIETLAHSVSKIAYPLSVGLPVIASPVPSYLETPVLICKNSQEWKDAFRKLISNPNDRLELGNQGRQYVYNLLSLDVIGMRYKTSIEELINEA